jgi:imidazolonepropionase-like amidohydrolase
MTSGWRAALAAGVLAALTAGCATTGASAPPGKSETSDARPLPPGLDPAADMDPFPSTYRPLPGRPTAIVGATVLTATGQQIDNGTVVFADGKIVAVGQNAPPPAGADVIDGHGKWVTPGIIDAHSHMGVYPAPGVDALSNGNELTDPNTAQVWAEHSIWPQDPQFNRSRAGGVTSMLILPGSGNLFGGRGVVVKNVPAISEQAMKFPGAPYSLKMACGENPKRVYGAKGRSPSTEMGNVFGYRSAWIKAAEYARKWDAYHDKVKRGEKAEPPTRDLQLDTLAGVLRGQILVQNHCYKADEMSVMMDVAKEFGYHIAMFHHASEAYKVADRLKAENICIATWADWSHFKMEAFDGIEPNAAIVFAKGACVVIHSDDPIIDQHLNQEAAIAMAAGNRLGINISRAQAIAWITANPAKAIGIGEQTGTLQAGKNADVVLWSGDPFSVYSKAEKVYIDGGLAYDLHDPRYQPKSDFELGMSGGGAFQ